jgi:hypothetical protein
MAKCRVTGDSTAQYTNGHTNHSQTTTPAITTVTSDLVTTLHTPISTAFPVSRCSQHNSRIAILTTEICARS